MELKLPREALFILAKLKKAGFDAYIVGGAVRDILLQVTTPQKVAADFDFTTNATPEEISAVFPESFYENTFGTVSVTYEHLLELLQLPLPELPLEAAPSEARIIDLAQARKIHASLEVPVLHTAAVHTHPFDAFEITTYRADGSYTDHRRPDQVTWGKTLVDDLNRRDFTINALALSVADSLLNQVLAEPGAVPLVVTLTPNDYTLSDEHGGLSDLQNARIRTVGNPAERFAEDALRLLRAIRFSVQLNMEIEHDTYTELSRAAELLQHVSAERIRDEFLKMLASEYPKQAIELLDDTHLLQFVLPELLETKDVAQSGHHTTDVWTHSLDALDACPSKDPIVRLATLLHDIAKPQTRAGTTGNYTFYNHEVVGARVAKRVAERLRLSRKDCDRIFILVRFHMFHYDVGQTDAAVRRFMRKVGLEHIDDILALREADRLGSGARKTSWRLEEMKERMIEQLQQPLSVTDLAINGTVLMAELKLQPGPIIGQILHTLFEKVLDEPELNTPETLLRLARELYALQSTST